MRVVEEVLKVGAWAEVKLVPGTERDVRSRLTLRMEDTGAVLQQFREHPSDASRLYVPRALATDAIRPVQGAWDDLNATSKLTTYREGQREAIDLYLGALQNPESQYGGILQAVTGAGKTAMALKIACHLNLKTLVVVPRSSLMKQWIEQIQKWTSAEEDEIGIVQGPKCEFKGKKFVVAMIHTLAQQLESFPHEFYRTFGTVIFDECHVVGAETFSRTAPMFLSKYRVGLSATPRRQDKMDSVFYWHIGPIISRFAKLQAKARVRVFPYYGKDTDHYGLTWGGKLNLGRYFNRVARSKERRELIVKIIAALDRADNDILVLSDRIQHLRDIRVDLVKAGIDNEKIGFLIGSQKELHKKIILGTYGSAGMGVDIPRLTALVLATPRADIEQAVGRVLRQGTPVVVDIVDMTSTIMKGWARARNKFYKRITDNIKVA